MRLVERALLCVLPLAVGCIHFRPEIRTSGVFFDGKGKAVSDAELTERLASQRFVLIGEAHDNPCDHDTERKLIELAAAAGPFAVGLEMVTFDRQGALDSYKSGAMDITALPEALDWKKTWRYPFDWYAPLFKAARGPLVALNAPESVVHAVRDHGLEGLSPEQKGQVTPELVSAPAEQEAMLRDAMREHRKPGKTPQDEKAEWDRFLRVQSFWDSEMAWRAAQAGHPIVIVAGGGHVEHGWGIASRLHVFAPGATSLSVMPWRGEEFDPTEADLFFFCPEVKSDWATVPAWTKPDSTSSPPKP